MEGSEPKDMELERRLAAIRRRAATTHVADSQAAHGASPESSGAEAPADLGERLALFAVAERLGQSGSWSFDLASGVTCWSAGLYPLLGLSEGETPTFETISTFCHPEDRPLLFFANRYALEQGAPYDIECRALPSGPGVRWLRLRAEATPENGHPAQLVGTVQDITTLKAASGRVEEVEKSLRAFVDGSSVSALVEIEGTVVHANPPLVALLGAGSAREVIGRPVGAHVAVQAPGASNSAEEGLLKRRDGTRVSVRLNTRPIRWNGAPASYVILEEVTPETSLREALGASEAWLRSILAANPAFILRVDLKGRITSLNRSDEGEVKAPALGSALWDWVIPEDRARVQEELVRILGAGEADQLEWRCATPDESPISFEVHVGPLWEGRALVGATVLVSNNEERRREDVERRHLQTAIEQLVGAIMVCDLNGDITYVNPGFARITGYGRAEVLGRNPRFLKSGQQDPVLYEQLWQTLLAGEVWSGRLVNRRKDGSLYTEDATISPVRDGSGAIVSYVAVKRDVSATLQMEEELRQSSRMEAIGQLAGGVAHDFNNQLTVIGLCSASLLDRGDLDTEALESIQEIALAADLAGRTTRQLLTFSRRQSIHPEALDVNEVVGRSAKMIRRLIGEDIKFVTSFEADLGACWADAGQLEQAVLNLALNARDAMPRGGALFVQTANVDLDRRFCRAHPGFKAGPYVLVSVSDDGAGIAPQLISRVFDPFFTTKEVGKGTGLGLATVHGIVKRCRGHILLDSELGAGTTFRMYFPRIASETVAPVEIEDPPRLKGGESILVLEDEKHVRILTVRMLQRYGYEVSSAASVGEALALIESGGGFDLLLSDVVMPRESGPVAAERIRRMLPAIQVLFMSGYTDETLLPYSITGKSVRLLEKPFGPDDLALAVRSVLDAAP